MPRFVRPAYIEGSADGVASRFGTGPRTRDGWLSARVTVRTADDQVSDPVTIDAGGTFGRLDITVPRSFIVETYTHPDGRTEFAIFHETRKPVRS